MRLVYAGEDGTTERANKETRWGNFAPRLGIAWDLTGDARNVVRAGYGRSFFPVPHAAGNLLDQNVPDSISQNYSVETNPLVYTPDRVPPLSNPFPAIVPLKPRTTAELNAANPLVFGHAFSNETPHMDTWQVSYERQITEHADGRGRLRRQQGLEPDLGRQHQRGAAGPRQPGLAPADPAALERGDDQLLRPSNKSSYNSLQVKLNQRFSHGLQYLASYTFGKSLDYAGSPPRAAAPWAARRA
jgi:hypothetical protein